ncbi:hypothetical protein AGABI2DRAFT_188538 [Agaricus bisporus var. bisporus H97]|uniref:hypothetical protein n=1 Tax=Agaricus bisporus var. bisporus (strain H97 / ATCC MYA-4626 / FGSC 10389) TaxID=936046 RepID=UPI00029F527D|nr:hypothetical protein AGABI2DRAFT_188538 [Agaricus bisporus var. bisporus H97]EKV42364.1 hypothetical protein AGABI2DRAFT_188538 [Agaricus bisporus var. bisporus H97]
MRSRPGGLPPSLLSLLLALLPFAHAGPATLPFKDCFDDTTSQAQKLNVSTIYAQVLQNNDLGEYLDLTVLGQSPQQIFGMTNTSGSLSTLFTTTSVLTLNAWTNSSYLCDTLRPPSPLPQVNQQTNNYCPLAAGPFALSANIPWGSNRALTTLVTRLRAVDPFGHELVCIDVSTTPLRPSTKDGPYGDARVILWASVALAAAYWLVVGVARVVSAWGRGVSRSAHGVWGKLQSGGFILASAISGERLATSPALMRYCTPSLRDVIFHTQWCATLAMIAVQWPPFIYPLLTQTAWSTLTFNVTLISSSTPHRWDPLSTLLFSPPDDFSEQLADSSSPLFIDTAAPNFLFTLPQNASNGIQSFAYAVGIRPEELFPNCLILFLGIVAATIVLSTLLWALDYFMVAVVFKYTSRTGYSTNLSRSRSPAFNASISTRSALNKDAFESTTSPMSGDESKSLTGHSTGGNSIFGVGTRAVGSHRSWWRLRTDIGSFHGSVLHGNLVRILVLFHLPITTFSAFQMVQHGSGVSRTSVALAALSFAVFSVLIPLHLVLKVTFTTTNKLYDETRTLLSLGPLYNHYRHGSQMFATLLFATNLVFGVTIGAGQKSGMAQAIIILVVEVMSALGTSIWLPWGSGASMGLISFLFCVARIVIAVLLVILTPTISIGPGPGGWVAYGILIILALVYLALLVMLFFKLVEAVFRIAGGLGFDRSRHVSDSGLLGVLGLLGWCGFRSHSKRRRKKSRKAPRHKSSQGLPEMSPYATPDPLLPSVPPFLHSDSRKASTHSGPPPSVLRPEHALPKPYREDDDDEGYIMGAWQPYSQKAGYSPVAEPAPTSPPQPKSGFSRIGGGRSHIDTPYAIMDGSGSAFAARNGSIQAIASSSMHALGNGSTHTFPSVKQQTQDGSFYRGYGGTAASGSVTALYEDDDPQPSLSSLTNVGRQAEYGQLPPGAMQPAHVRTKSQTAIIEDASKVYGLAATLTVNPSGSSNSNPEGGVGAVRPPRFSVSVDDDDDDDSSSIEEQPKKKPWYRIGRRRPDGSDGPSSSSSTAAPAVDSELGGILSAQPTRSFVVIRRTQPQSMNQLNQSRNASRLQNTTYPPS